MAESRPPHIDIVPTSPDVRIIIILTPPVKAVRILVIEKLFAL